MYLRNNEQFIINFEDDDTPVEARVDKTGTTTGRSTHNEDVLDTVTGLNGEIREQDKTENALNGLEWSVCLPNPLTMYVSCARQVLTGKQGIIDRIVDYIPQDADYTVVQPKANPQPAHVPHNINVASPLTINTASKGSTSSRQISYQTPSSTSAASKDFAGAATAPPAPGKFYALQTSGSAQTIRTSVHDAATDTTDGGLDYGTSLLETYESYKQTPSSSIKSAASVDDESSANTPRAGHTRALSSATTLRESTSRRGLAMSVLSDGEFRRKLKDEYQLLAEVQGQRDRRTVVEDQNEEENWTISFDRGVQPKGSKQGPLDQQAKTYEALLIKAKQDGKDALSARQDLHDDEMKYLQKDLAKVEGRKSLVEKRLKKVLLGQKAMQEENGTLTDKCKALDDEIAHKNEQTLYMSSTLQNQQQELEELNGRYKAICTQAEQQTRLAEQNARTMLDMRHSIRILTTQLTNSGQAQQESEEPLLNGLRSENARLLGIVANLPAGSEAKQVQVGSRKEIYSKCAIEASYKGLQHLLMHAERDIASLVLAVSNAKREHDSWTDNQLYGSPEDPLGDKVKVANHLAHKDKIYLELEKRYKDCSTTFEEHQKKATEDKKAAISSIISLRKELREQKEAVEGMKAQEDSYRKGNEKILEMLLGQMHPAAFVKALSYHFDLVRADNSVLVAKVGELDEVIKNLKAEAAVQGRKHKTLSKDIEVRHETAREFEEEKKALETQVNSLTYMSEVAEECHKEDIKKCRAHIETLNTELQTSREIACKLNRSSASERILWELNSKDEFIYHLKSEIVDVHNALAVAYRERDYFQRVSGMDDCLSACQDRDFVVLQRNLRLEEASVTELKEKLKDANSLFLKESSKYEEAFETEQLRVQELEKELHQLYQNLEGKLSYTPQDAPPSTATSQEAKENHAVLENLATRLWTRMLGLEDTLRTLGRSIIEPNNERAELRLACAGLLGLHEEEWEAPGGTTSDGDGREVEVVSGE